MALPLAWLGGGVRSRSTREGELEHEHVRFTLTPDLRSIATRSTIAVIPHNETCRGEYRLQLQSPSASVVCAASAKQGYRARL